MIKTRAIYSGKRLYLRRVQLSDARLIARWKKDPFIQRMALDPSVDTTVKSQHKDIRRALRAKGQLYFIIALTQKARPIGYVRINWIDSKHQLAWLRFALGNERGKGYCKEALVLLLRYLFKSTALRIEAEVYSYNKRSVELLRTLGFEIEGIKRKAHFDGEEYCDVYVMGLLCEEFKVTS